MADANSTQFPILPPNRARGGIACLRHILDGWPGGVDCPCYTGEVGA